MNTLTATVRRCDHWWAAEVPIGGTIQYTQGRTLAEVKAMVRDIAAIMAEERGDISLVPAEVKLSVTGPVHDDVQLVVEAQHKAEIAQNLAREAQRTTAHKLRKQGLTTQDVADLLGVSKGRVSQLTQVA